MSRPRTFRPAPVSIREWARIGLFAAMLPILATRLVRDFSWTYALGVGGVAALVGAGLFLALHHKAPGRPVLMVDSEGLRAIRHGRERRMAWRDVGSMPADFTRDTLSFVPLDGGKPIVVRFDLVSEDGEPFAGLIEEYWDPPKPAGKRKR